MKIDSYDRDVEQLLTMGYFVVPRFQRPYSWEQSEVEDFWNDTIRESETEYFIGSVVLFQHGEGHFGIVDGQQRLTTITMMLCALRDVFAAEGLVGPADGLHRLIERPDINNELQYVLQTETSYPYLQEYIQEREPPAASRTVGDEETRLREAFEYLIGNLREVVSGITDNPALSEKRKRAEIEKQLVAIRTKILRLKLIVITLDSEENAYVIFETMNTRGKDLNITDLARTIITRLIPVRNRKVDRPKERFSAIIESFEASEAPISMRSFIHHYWLSKYDYTSERKLYKAFKAKVRTRQEAKAVLDSLESDAVLYRVIHEPDSRKWRMEEAPLRDSLYALNLFKVRQQLPLVLSVLCEYRDGKLKLKHAIRALQAVENFHFIFTAVCSQRSSGGISFMYALHARQLRAQRTARGKISEINDLARKLREKLPAYQEFEANFRAILCSERFTRRKALVKYILGRMTKACRPDIGLDLPRMTVEHLAGQGSTPKGRLTDEEVAEVGNLVLVTEQLNAQLGTKAFPEKLEILLRSAVWVDDYLRSSTAWGAEQIRERSDSLARVAYQKVGKV